MRVALISLNQVWQDKATNLARCEKFIIEAVRNNCQLVIFPEMTLTGYTLDLEQSSEEIPDSASMRHFSDLARKNAVSIIFGMTAKCKNGKGQNILCLASPDKSAVQIYAKLHPFTFSGEEKVVDSGSELGFMEVADFRLGGSICYDLRFPLMFNLMAPECHGVVCIANWPASRVSHWRALLIARAIENQMYMLGINRIGNDPNGLNYEKSSMVVSPDGTILNALIALEEMDIFDIDKKNVENYRAQFPTLRDARTNYYFHLLNSKA